MTNIENWPVWLRWVLIPVFAAVAFCLVLAISQIAARIIVFIGPTSMGPSLNFFEYILNPAIAAFMSVRAAHYAAPAGKRVSAWIIAAIWGFAGGVVAIFMFMQADFKSLLFVASLLTGAGSAAWNAEDY